MDKSLTHERRRAKVLRRGQLRRRRAVGLVVLVTLVALAVWAAYAIPSDTPARIPAAAALPELGQSSPSPARLVVARLDGVDVLMPVPLEASTAVAYHAVDNTDAVPFSPAGDLLSGGS